jgi:hypothetical protein
MKSHITTLPLLPERGYHTIGHFPTKLLSEMLEQLKLCGIGSSVASRFRYFAFRYGRDTYWKFLRFFDSISAGGLRRMDASYESCYPTWHFLSNMTPILILNSVSAGGLRRMDASYESCYPTWHFLSNMTPILIFRIEIVSFLIAFDNCCILLALYNKRALNHS